MPAGLLRSRLTSAAPAEQPARIYVDSRRTIGPLHRTVFGSFLEHLGRAIYDGIFEPGSPLADAQGFRIDVLSVVRTLGVPLVRGPGGSFLSQYDWLDGVGPVGQRPRVLDEAWNSIETNQFGTDEFMAWCKAAGAETLMTVDLGSGTPAQAAALVEYCNFPGGTRWSDLRRKYGYPQPYNVRYWGLGNELDGPWEIGHMSAEQYGWKAADAARRMRAVDPSVFLTACGSSWTGLPTYLQWDRQVLDHCYEHVDAISIHGYFGAPPDQGAQRSARHVALNLEMERQIRDTIDVCDYVRARKRSPKTLWISFDEWNVLYGNLVNDGKRQVAPHLREEIYNLQDALLLGGLLNTLMRHSDRVRIACLSQLVNVHAPIMTDDKGLFLQTTYYPYRWVLELARGSALDLLVTAPAYDLPDMKPVPYIDAAGTVSRRTGETALFILNRDLEAARPVEIVWEDKAPGSVKVALVLTGDDVAARNDFDAPRRVHPTELPRPVTRGGRTRLDLPPRSYTAIQWGA
ncbi:MAG: alpha-N-arabinofuranosidase [Steroidobacteraceae bacterium]